MRLTILICLATAVSAQTFDVASVKVSPPIGSAPVRFGMISEPGRIVWSHATVKSLLVDAYELPVYLFTGPDWLNMDMFDITATLPPDTPGDQMRAMLRNLLAERFGMQAHREKRDLPTFAITVGKGGPKMKASDSTGAAKTSSKMSPGKATLTCTGCTTGKLAEILTQRLNRPVTDATGLTRAYDFTLVYEPEFQVLPGADGPPPPPPGSADASPIQAAIQAQLGLKLEPRKSPVEMLVIDRIEKTPTEN